MYTIRVNDNGALRDYNTTSYFDATSLFHAIATKFHEVWVYNSAGICVLKTA